MRVLALTHSFSDTLCYAEVVPRSGVVVEGDGLNLTCNVRIQPHANQHLPLGFELLAVRVEISEFDVEHMVNITNESFFKGGK